MTLSEIFSEESKIKPVEFNSGFDRTADIYANIFKAQQMMSNISHTIKSPFEFNQDSLIDFLKLKEGFRPEVYTDSGGVKTIGYGFTDPELIERGYITEEEATEILKKEIKEREKKLESQIPTWFLLNNNQKSALISYGYNVGVENWEKYQPKLFQALASGDFANAAQYMDIVKDRKGNILPGLVTRRKEEQEMFNKECKK